MKKILTLDDLVNVCKEQKLVRFNSAEAGYKLRVRVPATFAIDEDEEQTSTLFAHVQVMHTGRNRNGSNLTEKAAKNCLKTMAYKPLLANFCEIDGVRDFTSHDFIVNDDDEIEYLERQIGCLTADAPYMEDDSKVEGRKNIFARVAIPREYTDAAEIIERKNGTKVSAELDINSMSYDSKEKELLLEEVELIGLTCLGTNPITKNPVEEGMEGSRIQFEDFSADNNSSKFALNEDIKQFIQSSVEKVIDKTILKKGGIDRAMEFDEKALVTDDLTEDTVAKDFADEEPIGETPEDNVPKESDEEGADVAEAKAEDTEDTVPPESEDVGENIGENDTDSTDAADESKDTEDTESEDAVDGDAVAEAELNSLRMSVNVEGEIRTFEISLRDKINALYELVNTTYGESDNDYYDVDVYEDSKTVVFHGWFSGKHFKQNYSVKKEVYSLKGDRTEVYAQFLTTDEISQLDAMRANYSSIELELAKYKAEPEKISVLESEDYKNLAGNEAFEALKTQENHFDLSVDELKSKCDSMLLEYAKGNEIHFEKRSDDADSVEKKSVAYKRIIPESPNKRVGKYGGVFSRKK